MDIIIKRGCGLDVHKKTIAACIMGIGHKKGNQDLQYHDE